MFIYSELLFKHAVEDQICDKRVLTFSHHQLYLAIKIIHYSYLDGHDNDRRLKLVKTSLSFPCLLRLSKQNTSIENMYVLISSDLKVKHIGTSVHSADITPNT